MYGLERGAWAGTTNLDHNVLHAGFVWIPTEHTRKSATKGIALEHKRCTPGLKWISFGMPGCAKLISGAGIPKRSGWDCQVERAGPGGGRA